MLLAKIKLHAYRQKENIWKEYHVSTVAIDLSRLAQKIQLASISSNILRQIGQILEIKIWTPLFFIAHKDSRHQEIQGAIYLKHLETELISSNQIKNSVIQYFLMANFVRQS